MTKSQSTTTPRNEGERQPETVYSPTDLRKIARDEARRRARLSTPRGFPRQTPKVSEVRWTLSLERFENPRVTVPVLCISWKENKRRSILALAKVTL